MQESDAVVGTPQYAVFEIPFSSDLQLWGNLSFISYSFLPFLVSPAVFFPSFYLSLRLFSFYIFFSNIYLSVYLFPFHIHKFVCFYYVKRSLCNVLKYVKTNLGKTLCKQYLTDLDAYGISISISLLMRINHQTLTRVIFVIKIMQVCHFSAILISTAPEVWIKRFRLINTAF